MSRIKEFVNFVRSCIHKGDRGTLADLRKGINMATEHKALPHISKWCNLTDDKERKIWLIVAYGLSICQASYDNAGNFGFSLRNVANRRQNDKYSGDKDPFDAHMRRILSCRTSRDLIKMLGPYFRRIKREGVGVNFEKLFYDIGDWPDAKIVWADAYWNGFSRQGNNPA